MAKLRFMSWNWNCFSDNRNDRKVELITRLAPDVVALQEIDDNALEHIDDRLPDWAVRLPHGRSGEAWPKVRGQAVPCVALIARPGLRLSAIPPPDLEAWRTAEVRARAGFEPDFERRDDAMPDHRSFAGATVRIGDREVVVVSAHGPHAASRDKDLAKLRVMLKRRTYAVLREWVSGRSPLVLGIDANAWADSGEHPLADELSLGEGGPQDDIMMFVQNGYLPGMEDPADPKDAFRMWLDANEQVRKAIMQKRPNGPWATTYNRSMNHPRPDRRDLVMVSRDIGVTRVEHDYESSLAAGSDHSYVLCELEI